ncbi:hypothetical protein, partial [Pseudomonas viridiflava]|uniref:hypothetical protein n=1 Tax=Pseudomonas viridiflava TaxID=33069 RepID=UPI00197BE720
PASDVYKSQGTISVISSTPIMLMPVLSVIPKSASTLIVPMLRVSMHPVTLRVTNGPDCGFSEPSA